MYCRSRYEVSSPMSGRERKLRLTRKAFLYRETGRSSFLPREKEVPRRRSRLSTLDNEIPATPGSIAPYHFSPLIQGNIYLSAISQSSVYLLCSSPPFFFFAEIHRVNNFLSVCLFIDVWFALISTIGNFFNCHAPRLALFRLNIFISIRLKWYRIFFKILEIGRTWVCLDKRARSSNRFWYSLKLKFIY